MACLAKASRQHGVWLVGGSIPERRDLLADDKSQHHSNLYYNTSLVFNPVGQLVGNYSKMHLFDLCIPGQIEFQESKVMTAGDHPLLLEMAGGWRVGLGICYDLRFPRLAEYYRQREADLLIYPGAFNLTTGPLHWELLQRATATQQQLFVATCAPARNDHGYISYAHSMVSDPLGRVLADAGTEEKVLVVDLHRQLIEETRRNIPISKQQRSIS